MRIVDQRRLCRDLEGKFLRTILDSGKSEVSEDVDMAAFQLNLSG